MKRIKKKQVEKVGKREEEGEIKRAGFYSSLDNGRRRGGGAISLSFHPLLHGYIVFE